MNVLQIVSHFPYPAVGGLEFAVYNLSIELAHLGHSVVIAAPSESPRSLKTEGVTVEGVPSWFIADHFYLPRPGKLGQLLKYLEWADVVHIHSPHNTFTQFSIVLARLTRKPIVLSVLSHTMLVKHPRIIGKVGGLFLESIAQVLIRWATIAHVRNPQDQAIVSRVNRRVVIVPDGIRAALFTQGKKPGLFKKRSNIENATPIILYLGRLHPMKGPQKLIEILPELMKYHPSIIAVIAEPSPGEGNYATKLLGLARRLGVSNHLMLMTGGINEEEKIAVIDDANVVAVPSLSDSTEAFSIVTSEAWARGKPVVAFPVGALRVRIRNGVNGYLASSMRTNDLTRATLKALSMKTVERSSDVLPIVETARTFELIYNHALEARGTST